MKNPYYTMYKYNKLYKHTFTRMFKEFLEINKPCSSITSVKSVCKDESPDRDKKDDKDIIPASGYDSYLPRNGLTNTRDNNPNNWQRKQI